ncbi:MAG: MFS transporter [Ilumatobacteraceae bacterium]|nr:MFS transporter [Ilumatobacteraceae bacterium]
MTDTTEISIDSGRRRPSPGAILAVVGFSVFVAADDLTVVSTMLRPIIGDLGLVLPDGLDDAAWIVNAYLIAFVAIMPIAGRISDVLGRRRTFVGAYLLFLVGTILIPLSVEFDSAFGWFLTGRVMTAIGGGAMVPVALAVVGDVYPEGKRARALGTLGAIETMGWVWGPLYGAMLVRFLSWQWQFWLNIPFAIAGLAASWWALEGHDRPEHRQRIDWLGAVLLTVTLVSLNVALLGSAEIQSVNGLSELTGEGTDWRFLYLVALGAGVAFVWQQRRSDHPLFDRRLFRGRNLLIALFVNFVVGAALVIAMVDVPLFINSVELDLERSAVVAGSILSALTAAMAVMSYVGGRATERWWYRPPVLAGLAMSTGAYAWMGATWTSDTSYPVFAIQLALLGGGFGLTVAPTTSAVVDAAPSDQRGAAASVVMVVRLMGFSVGLSALTAWGLARFNDLRSTIDLPSITDPGFEAAVTEAQETLTAQAIAETFTAAAVVIGAGLLATAAMKRRNGDTNMDTERTPDEVDAPIESHDDAPIDSHDVAEPVPIGEAEPVSSATRSEIDALATRMNVLIGLLAVLLVGAFVVIALMMSRVADAQDDAAAARSALESTEQDLATTQADLERVEAGAALYASQITGFQEQLVALEPQVSAGVEEAIAGLREFGDSTIAFDVEIDEVIPVKTDILLDRVVQVPIKTTIPINESFDTTITIDTPFGGIPLDVNVPVDVDVPVDLVVDIPINETVELDEEFPVQLDVPIAIEVRDTELASLTDSLAAGLEALQDVLTGLG